jgi:hypothetical protein
MDFYRKLVIKVLESSLTGSESHLLPLLKAGEDLTQKERRELEELIEQIL